jgi:PII-like signaling protein
VIELNGRAQRLSIFVGESDLVGRTPLAAAIVERAHAAGLAGATVLRGVEGYGATNHIHTTRILSLSEDLPIVIVIVDRPDRIASFLPAIEEIIGGGLIVIDDVHVVRYSAESPGDRPP